MQSPAAHYDDLKVVDGVLQMRPTFPADRAVVPVVAVDILHTKRLGTDAAPREVVAAALWAQAVGRGWR
jgi:hypothetical protein